MASLFDDDDHNDNYCYPNWGHGGVYYGGRPYYPHNTFVYAPRGAGYRPTPYYRPPANYQNRYNNNYNRNNNVNRNTNINVNNNNNYMNRFDKNQNRLPSYNARSPVAASNARNDYRGQSTYNGADRPRANTTNSQLPANAQRPGAARTGQNATTGTYQGARTGQADATQRQNTQRQNTQRQTASTAQRPGAGADRGYPKTTGSRPDVSAATQNRGGSISGAGRNEGAADRAASERGRSSMKSAPRPSSSAQGGGRSGGGRAAGGGGRAAGGGGGGRRS